ncbi:MAG: methionyl-tRNA formyltransferase [Bacteroidetes bacterium]|nr:MAG: methionyl-tRNA formyltransferase [Bacteroidota bacterium]
MDENRLRVVFMGTPEFAATCLETLLDGRHKVVGVVTAPDRESGRGRKISCSAVKKLAIDRGLPIEQPVLLRDVGFLERLREWNADLGVVVAFRMLPEVVWNMPKMGTVNLHGSLLPQFRGAAPIQRAIMAGASESGATTFLLSHSIDTGDVLGRVKLDIHENENAGSLHDRILEAGKKLLASTIDNIADGTVNAKPQSSLAEGTEDDLLEAPKLFKEDRIINWNSPTAVIHNLIRGLSPYPGAITYLPSEVGASKIKGDAPIKILESSLSEKTGLVPGEISTEGDKLIVGTKDGAIEIARIQPSGKSAMKIQDYLRGIRTPITSFVSLNI